MSCPSRSRSVRRSTTSSKLVSWHRENEAAAKNSRTKHSFPCSVQPVSLPLLRGLLGLLSTRGSSTSIDVKQKKKKKKKNNQRSKRPSNRSIPCRHPVFFRPLSSSVSLAPLDLPSVGLPKQTRHQKKRLDEKNMISGTPDRGQKNRKKKNEKRKKKKKKKRWHTEDF